MYRFESEIPVTGNQLVAIPRVIRQSDAQCHSNDLVSSVAECTKLLRKFNNKREPFNSSFNQYHYRQ